MVLGPMPALQRWSGLEIDGELVWFKVLGFVSCKAVGYRITVLCGFP